ncbi:hypothetical protein CAPTEDRAFT_109881, partial [Capitella teleta]
RHEFSMEMTCEGCSNAATRVLTKAGGTDIVTDLASKKVLVTSDKSSDELLEILKKTGKAITYVGPVN